MRTYIARRILLFVPVLIGISMLIFIFMRVVPGDVAVTILAGPDGGGTIDPVKLEQLREKLGLRDPLVVQYGRWVWDLVRLQPGNSLVSGAPVMGEIRLRLPVTLELAILSMIISLSIAVPLGILMAMRQDTPVDYIARMLSIGGLAMPTFWSASLMILFLSLWFNWLPPLGYHSFFSSPIANLKQMIWPALSLGYLMAAVVSRMIRTSLLEVFRQDYVRTATAKGLSHRLVVTRHALKNALIPVVTVLGVQIAALASGSVIMESIFSLPGLGRSLVTAIQYRDYPMVQTLVVVFAFFVVISNLVVDVAYAWFDPRVHYK